MQTSQDSQPNHITSNVASLDWKLRLSKVEEVASYEKSILKFGIF